VLSRIFLFIFLVFRTLTINAQAEKIIVITLDGMRWQEVFKGADTALMSKKEYVTDSSDLANDFWDNDLQNRRKKLFPFLWNVVNRDGQLLGNRDFNNNVNCANRYKFSYPGYNEIFTGYPDTNINSNNKIWNSNITVLEFLNNQARFKGKTAVFATWDVFPYILNRTRSGIYINADMDSLRFPDRELRLINEMQYITTRPIGVRPDVFTYFAAREYLKLYKPDILYIAFDETDDFAHAGKYDQYLRSAYAVDKMMADLWTIIQQMPEYKNKTTLIVTTDHGRGDIDKNNWRHHGERIKEADQIWIAAIGAGIPTRGEVTSPNQVYQSQIAATIDELLGYKFIANHPVAPPMKF
jgi:hypothetical protein